MMNDDCRSLIPVPDSSLANTAAGTKRIVSAMVEETLALTRQEQAGIQTARWKIGEYEWREPDYRQIIIWAEAMVLDPEEVIRRLLEGEYPEYPQWRETKFGDGALLKLNWDMQLLPLGRFEWVDGLAMTHLNFSMTTEETRILSIRLPSLTHLSCAAIGLTELDISGAPMLTNLSCYCNQLTELDLSLAPMLTMLSCHDNQLTKLDLSGVPKLTFLWCDGNQLTELDLSGVPKLTFLWCDGNQLTELDLSLAPMLTMLSCHGNQLTKLELSGVPKLTFLWCYRNQLTELDIRSLFSIETLRYDPDSTRLIQRPDQHF